MNGIPVALGTAKFGSDIDQEKSFRILEAYSALGGRVIDTANNYAYWLPNRQGGESETVIGNWLSTQNCDDFTVMTKIGSQPINPDADDIQTEGLSAAAVTLAVEKSLNRLQTDCIDIVLTHHDDRNTPLLETWEQLSSLVRLGKIRQIGISNYEPERVNELCQIIEDHSLEPIDYIQLKYSCIIPVKGTDTVPLVVLNQDMKKVLTSILPNVTVFAYSPLLGGFYEELNRQQWPSMYDSAENRQRVTAIQEEAKRENMTPSAYVLKTIVEEGFYPVTSSSNIDRLKSNLSFCL